MLAEPLCEVSFLYTHAHVCKIKEYNSSQVIFEIFSFLWVQSELIFTPFLADLTFG